MACGLRISSLVLEHTTKRALRIDELGIDADSGLSLFERTDASEDFAKVLEHCSITPSMSRKGNCWDNACSETLFGSLKVERLHGRRFETIREAKDEIITWLLWYNQTRMHSALGYRTPEEFEQQIEASVSAES